ncbi:hypothetical protein F0562_008682 [Nyssa sinensis]|uniref:Transmembrane protein 245 n=1 Tax=Nyssa sinensis TaxID=561372 RepID=A0A5J5A9X7_9ASTE|nr:hypothetical protein F0562_008682 [Nyssa sinensis]
MDQKHSPSAKLESNPRSSSDLSWQVMFRSASFRKPNSTPQDNLTVRSVSFRHPINSSSGNCNPTRMKPASKAPEPNQSTRLSDAEVLSGASLSPQHVPVSSPGPDDSTSSALSWKVMFRSASFRKPSSCPRNHASSPQNHVQPPQEPADETSEQEWDNVSDDPEVFSEESLSMEPILDSNSGSSTLPQQVMFQSASFQEPNFSPRNDAPLPEIQGLPSQEPAGNPSEPIQSSLSGDPLVRLALYIAMAHAGLALIIFLLYSVYKLLEEYLIPIQWAVLCSIPLRGIQDTLVGFWSQHLRLGLRETILAVPVTMLKLFFGTLVDIRDFCFSVILHQTTSKVSRESRRGFLKLIQMLVSFGVFVIAFERSGGMGSLAIIGLGFMSTSLFESTASIVSSFRSSSSAGCNTSSTFLIEAILRRLKTIVAIGLIFGLIAGFLAGLIFFSYKIAVEGKDALIMLKSHVEDSNYAERIGIKKWMNDNNITQLADWYTHFCEAVSQYIDSWAAHYNLTEFVNGMKHVMADSSTNSSEHSAASIDPSQYSKQFQSLKNQVSKGEWGNVYKEMEEILRELSKGYAAQGMDVLQHAFASSMFVLSGSTKLVFSIGYSVISGAAGLLNFGLQSLIFFWVLYYLITSESGGVTEQVIGLLPISRSSRIRYIQILNNAVSGVLLATAEVAFFQGCLTWLLFRLYSIHFLYMSTVLAFISPLLPIFPPWLSTILAALQLVFERRYSPAIILSIIHLVLMDYGASEIQEDIPGYSTYLTGLSIIGGMTLFPSAIEVNSFLFSIHHDSSFYISFTDISKQIVVVT